MSVCHTTTFGVLNTGVTDSKETSVCQEMLKIFFTLKFSILTIQRASRNPCWLLLSDRLIDLAVLLSFWVGLFESPMSPNM